MPRQKQIEQDAPARKPGRPAKAKTCIVLVMHNTNIMLSVGKKAFRERAEIPVEEYEEISAGDAAAGRPQRLELIR